jgi:hypothetical protein
LNAELVEGEPVTDKSRNLATISNITRLKAHLEGDLPHEILLKIARGDPIRHTRVVSKFGNDGLIESQELIEEDVFVDLATRIDCAKAAAPYYAPRLAAQQVSVSPGGPGAQLKSMTMTELDREIANLQTILKLTEK